MSQQRQFFSLPRWWVCLTGSHRHQGTQSWGRNRMEIRSHLNFLWPSLAVSSMVLPLFSWPGSVYFYCEILKTGGTSIPTVCCGRSLVFLRLTGSNQIEMVGVWKRYLGEIYWQLILRGQVKWFNGSQALGRIPLWEGMLASGALNSFC